MQVSKFTEVRTVEGFTAEVEFLAYDGKGVLRSDFWYLGNNAAHPYTIHNKATRQDGVLRGKVKVVRIKGCVKGEWFSLRLIGGAVKRTVYLRSDARVITPMGEVTMGEFYAING